MKRILFCLCALLCSCSSPETNKSFSEDIDTLSVLKSVDTNLIKNGNNILGEIDILPIVQQKAQISPAKAAKSDSLQLVAVVNDSLLEIIDSLINYEKGRSHYSEKLIFFFDFYIALDAVFFKLESPGDLSVGYAGTGQNFDPSDLKGDAFKSGAWINVVGGCQTAIDDKFLFTLPVEKKYS